MSGGLREQYERLGTAGLVSEEAGVRAGAEAMPHALRALAEVADIPRPLPVTVRLVAPETAVGGIIVPAWPLRVDDGSVVIEIVEDWGVILAAWRTWMQAPAWDADAMDELCASGERPWVGVANDVMQLYVPAPPEGDYSMIRHHGLMLGGATLWLGAERRQLWQRGHGYSAQTFLRQLNGQPLWPAVAEAEAGIAVLLADPRAKQPAAKVIDWLEADPAAAKAFAAYLACSSLGIVALMETAPEDYEAWLSEAVARRHPQADFNRVEIEAYAQRVLDLPEGHDFGWSGGGAVDTLPRMW